MALEQELLFDRSNPILTKNHGNDRANHAPIRNNGEDHTLTKNHGAALREKSIT